MLVFIRLFVTRLFGRGRSRNASMKLEDNPRNGRTPQFGVTGAPRRLVPSATACFTLHLVPSRVSHMIAYDRMLGSTFNVVTPFSQVPISTYHSSDPADSCLLQEITKLKHMSC